MPKNRPYDQQEGAREWVLAAADGDVKRLSRLIELHRNVNEQWAALHITPVLAAVARGHCAAAKLLIKAGADLHGPWRIGKAKITHFAKVFPAHIMKSRYPELQDNQKMSALQLAALSLQPSMFDLVCTHFGDAAKPGSKQMGQALADMVEAVDLSSDPTAAAGFHTILIKLMPYLDDPAILRRMSNPDLLLHAPVARMTDSIRSERAPSAKYAFQLRAALYGALMACNDGAAFCILERYGKILGHPGRLNLTMLVRMLASTQCDLDQCTHAMSILQSAADCFPDMASWSEILAWESPAEVIVQGQLDEEEDELTKELPLCALLWAIEAEQHQLVLALVKAGARTDVETSWPPRLSPLHFAASKGNLSIMRTLIKIGKMDPCVHSPKGLTTAGMYTSARRRTCTKDPTASIDWLSVFRELEDMGCSLTQLSTGGDTLLMTAVQLTPSCVLGLLEAMFGETRSDKMKAFSPQQQSEQPLPLMRHHHAHTLPEARSRYQTAEDCISDNIHNFSPESKKQIRRLVSQVDLAQMQAYIRQHSTGTGDTALHKAAITPSMACICETHWKGNPEMLYILICLGAAERPRNAAGLTPLGHALSWGAEEMIIFELGLLLGTACICCRKRAADDLLQRQLPSGASALAAGKLHEPIMLAVLHARKQHLDTLLGSLHVVLREDGLEWVKVQKGVEMVLSQQEAPGFCQVHALDAAALAGNASMVAWLINAGPSKEAAWTAKELGHALSMALAAPQTGPPPSPADHHRGWGSFRSIFNPAPISSESNHGHGSKQPVTLKRYSAPASKAQLTGAQSPQQPSPDTTAPAQPSAESALPSSWLKPTSDSYTFATKEHAQCVGLLLAAGAAVSPELEEAARGWALRCLDIEGLKEIMQPLAKSLSKIMACARCGLYARCKRCQACHQTFYCSRQCQTQHWSLHSKHCKKNTSSSSSSKKL